MLSEIEPVVPIRDERLSRFGDIQTNLSLRDLHVGHAPSNGLRTVPPHPVRRRLGR